MAYVTKINGYDIKDSEARSDVSTLQESMTTAQGDITTLQDDVSDTKADLGDITALDTTVKTSAVNAINEVNGKADDNADNIGTLSSLTTTDKASLVSAINEVNGKADDNADNIGTLSSLTTTDKASLVSAINEVNTKTPMINTTWSELKALRDGGNLVKGMQYRITDFVTTTIQADTQSAGHAFDLIVSADSESVLNENARAIQHEGDTYFASSNLSAWKLKYCLDNDTTRFDWADTTNGKGVIYRMIDERENDLPYYFKNIQFKRYKANGHIYRQSTSNARYNAISAQMKVFLNNGTVNTNSLPYYYQYVNTSSISGTWYDENGDSVDGSTLGTVNNFLREPPNIVLGVTSEYKYFYTFSYMSGVEAEPTDATISYKTVYKNKFGWGEISSNALKLGANVFLGNNFNSNTVGNNFYSNTVGNNFNSNTVGNNFNSNTVGNDFNSNTVGNNFYANTVGNYFNSNTAGNDFYYNTVGNNFYSNTVGSNFNSNTVGNDFNHNTVGNNFYSNTVGNYYKNNHVEDGCSNLNFSTNGTSSSYVQKYRVFAGTAPDSVQIVNVTAGNTIPYNVKQTGANTISVSAA